MNIKKAKEEIKNTILAYLKKDEYGSYRIPVTNQRPLFIIGPPGVGKTAIMEQVAEECKIGMISYTITHHTRQSAIGLPFIEKQIYGGKEHSFTEYTMSEIVASVYKKMEETGLREGILFIDEINCVSETLSATMLQFLKEKAFGNHKVPDGWIIVTAGNPAEYNKSVREFDMVTLDRLRKIHVEEDYKTWKEYAYKQSVHASIISYLDMKREHFYIVETKVDGKEFVTARGWEDLSKMLVTYEEIGLAVDEELIYQYLQHRRISKDFSNYYDFYLKYKSEYSVTNILEGQVDSGILGKIMDAPFDERLTVVGLLLGKLYEYFKELMIYDIYMADLFQQLKALKDILLIDNFNVYDSYKEIIEKKQEDLDYQILVSHLDKNQIQSMKKVIRTIEDFQKESKSQGIEDGMEAFQHAKVLFESIKARRDSMIQESSNALYNAFTFMKEAFMESHELVIFITELTMNYYSSKFIADYGSEEYDYYNKEMLFKDSRSLILNEINEMMIEL